MTTGFQFRRLPAPTEDSGSFPFDNRRTRQDTHTRDGQFPSAPEIARLGESRGSMLIRILNGLLTPLMMIKSPLQAGSAADGLQPDRLLDHANRIQEGLERAVEILEKELRGVREEWIPRDFVRTHDPRTYETRSETAETIVPTSGTDEETAPTSPRTTVLIVDDHQGTRAYLRYALRRHHNILEACDGMEALELARKHRPDLILSDVMMPIMNGNELCRAIKADETLNHIPVFLITANAIRTLKTEGLACGADDYLVKPFDVKEAVMRISNEIRSRSELRRRYRREVVIKPSDITVTPEEEAFVNRAREIVEEHIDDADFSVTDLSSELSLSARQLQRRLRETVDQSPVEFVRMLRLQRAAQLLEGRYGNVSEVAYSVGFTSLSYFAKCFKERFGESPSTYKENAL